MWYRRREGRRKQDKITSGLATLQAWLRPNVWKNISQPLRDRNTKKSVHPSNARLQQSGCTYECTSVTEYGMPRKSITTLSLLQNGHILYWYTVMSSPSKCLFPPAAGAAAAAVDAADAEHDGIAPAASCLCTATVETQSPAPPTAERGGDNNDEEGSTWGKRFRLALAPARGSTALTWTSGCA